MTDPAKSSTSDPKGVAEGDVSRVVPQGNFPFPRLGDGYESRQLVWLRNHANYLANRGWLDYLRAASIILRGVVVNMLIGLPFLIAMAVFVALLSVKDWGFASALIFVAATLVWIVLSPILTRLWNIFRLQNTLAMGTSSSVKTRDRFERSFGGFLAVTILVAAIEGLSFFLDDFHFWVNERDWGGPQLASIGTIAASLFAAAGQILPKLGGKARSVAILFVGLVGVFVPIIIVMFLANFFAFGGATATMTLAVALAGFVLAAIIAVGFVLLLWTEGFRLRENIMAAGVLVVALGVFGGFLAAADTVSTNDAQLQTDLLMLDLSRTTRNERPAGGIISRPPAEVDSLVELRNEFDDWVNEQELAEIFGTAGKYSGLTTEELEAAENVDLALAALSEHASFLPGVGELRAAINSEGIDQSTGIDSESLEQLGAELTLLTLRTTDLKPLFAPENDAELMIGAALSVALADPRDSGFSETDFEETGDLLMRVSATLIAIGEEERDAGIILADSASGDDAGDDLEAGYDLVDIGLDRIERGNQLGIIGGAMYSGEGPVYLASHFYETPGLPLSPIGAPITAAEFPLVAELYPFVFSGISWDLFELENVFLDAREEIARSAVFSGRALEVVSDNPDVADIRSASFGSSAIFAFALAVVVWAYGWLAVDPNRTSLHGMYRDRLAAAFLVGADTQGDVDIEEDLDLHELSRYEAGSTAPYHIINTALNLQGSKDISIHDRSSDFFIFSKRFIGGERTGYCRSDTMERAFPEMSLSTAMAISAAAASPNMGRSTQPALVAFMTLLNIRLGFWMPNPGRLEAEIGLDPKPDAEARTANSPFKLPPGFCTAEVVATEADELAARWRELGSDRTVEGGLVGLALSGGGIRSATLNLGLVQTLFEAGVFDQVDYMSTVSGGGYLGSSISSAMRSREITRSQVTSSNVTITNSDDGKVVIETPPNTRKLVPKRFRSTAEPKTKFTFGSEATLNISKNKVRAGQRLLKMGDPNVLQHIRTPAVDQASTPWWQPGGGEGSFGSQFSWRVRPTALLREVSGRLNENSRSINVSDGGHIENLAVVELLRRRCRYIIVGDGGMDLHHNFGALTVLIRTARVEFGIDIDIDLDPLRLDDEKLTREHWAIGKINYSATESGYLLYCKSSLVGDEDEDILGYRKAVPLFPHQSTADQFFDEGQFESYRILGQHIGKNVLGHMKSAGKATYNDIQEWFEELYRYQQENAEGSSV